MLCCAQVQISLRSRQSWSTVRGYEMELSQFNAHQKAVLEQVILSFFVLHFISLFEITAAHVSRNISPYYIRLQLVGFQQDISVCKLTLDARKSRFIYLQCVQRMFTLVALFCAIATQFLSFTHQSFFLLNRNWYIIVSRGGKGLQTTRFS